MAQRAEQEAFVGDQAHDPIVPRFLPLCAPFTSAGCLKPCLAGSLGVDAHPPYPLGSPPDSLIVWMPLESKQISCPQPNPSFLDL